MLRISRATIEEAPAILDLQKLAYQSEARLYDDSSLPPLIQDLESLRDEFRHSVVLAALAGPRIVGSVRARLVDDVSHIGRLIVHPEFQRLGVGTLLLREIERAHAGARTFELFTGSRSEGNLRLYERLGYRRSHEKVVSSAVTLVFLRKPHPEDLG